MHYEEMAAFCGFFAWCSPERFWNLDLDEYAALSKFMVRQMEANRGS